MQNKDTSSAHQVPDTILLKTFIRIGSQSFGGWSTTVVLIDKALDSHTFKPASVDLKAATAYAQILPGATQVALVSNVGYQIKGFRGALLATVSYLIPAVALIIVFAFVYFRFLHSSDILDYLGGLIAALCGIILANAYKIGSKHVTHPVMWLLVVAACLALLLLQIHALAIILTFGGAGLAIAIIQRRRKA